MTEQHTVEAPDYAVEQYARKQALQLLTSTMLSLFGEPDEQRGRSVAWTDGDYVYCLDGEGQGTWMHMLDADGEHAAYTLTDIAGQDELVQVLHAEARRRIFGKAKEHFAGRDAPVFAVQHNGHLVTFEDFTNAPHGPFVWIKVGQRANYVAYDLSVEELRRAAVYGNEWPVPRTAPQEALLGWMMEAVTREIADPSRLPRPPYGGQSHRPLVTPEVANDPESISDFVATDIAQLAESMEAWSHGGVSVRRHGKATSIRTVLDIITHDYTTQAGLVVPTAIGLVYDHESLFMEAFEVASEGHNRKVIKVDIARRKAFGSNVMHNKSEGYRGESAANEVYNLLVMLDDAYNGDESLTQCTPQVAANFQYRLLRPEQQEGNVQ